jgi:hypothetical protein
MIHRFYKENRMWYIDLPQFLEQGLGTKSNLLMVGGADTLLDKLSNNTDEVTLQISELPFVGWTTWLRKLKNGKDDTYLKEVGHAPVNDGAYYNAVVIDNVKTNHEVWLCPVTEYVFDGAYPEDIYVKIISG